MKIVKKKAVTKRATRIAKQMLKATILKIQAIADKIILRTEPIKTQRP